MTNNLEICRSSFQDFNWYKAVTLAERAALLSSSQLKSSAFDINISLAKRKMNQWRLQHPFDSDKYFAQLLAINEIEENDFVFLLGESNKVLEEQHNFSPAWVSELKQVLSNADFFNSISDISSILPKQQEQNKNWKRFWFLNLVKPFIGWARSRLRKGVHELLKVYQSPPFDPATIENLLLKELPSLLLSLIERTLVLELNVARLEGILTGETAQERFQSFVQHLSQDSTAFNLFKEYPTLTRQIIVHINNWVDFRLEALQHLCADWNDIRATFSSVTDPGLLTKINSNVGDLHRRGRSVLILKFSSNFQLVYKPRSLAVDLHFYELLTWLNEIGCQPKLQTQKVLDRESYGWVNYITAKGCSSKEEVQRFYKRQGCYLALLYALEASDLHYENLIAVGEHPVLVDLESLFQPHIDKLNLNPSVALNIDIAQSSVLRIAMLPQRWWLNSEFEGVEISGLGGAKEQLLPDRELHLEGIGTDEMRFVRKQAKTLGGRNLPKLADVEVNPLDYLEDIVTGFTSMYQLLVQHRQALLSNSSPLFRFAKDEMRIILRPTRSYSSLLYESLHPDLLRNTIDRDLFFDKLWLDVKQSPSLAEVIKYEKEDLFNGDIPLFLTRPGSCDLWSSCGEKIARFFDKSGMNLVRDRLQHLNEQDLAHQVWVIRASLATLSSPLELASVRNTDYSKILSEETYNSERLRQQSLIASEAVGKRLEALAWHNQDKSNWLGLSMINQETWGLIPLETSLYEGLPGVIMFLAYLGAILEEKRYTFLANSALMTLQSQLNNDDLVPINSIGSFKGWGGIIYTLVHLSVLWNRPELLSQSEGLVELLPDLIEKDEQFDIVGGAAGCICSLLTLYNVAPSERVLEVAVQCGDHLVTHARPMKQGIGWISKDTSQKALAGFSHGVAGISMALLKLAEATSKERFLTTALQAIEYERSLFIPIQRNWSDLRSFSNSILEVENNHENCMTAWCHGAPGIGMARLQSLPYLDEPEFRSEIDSAIKTTLSHGFGNNHSLCHGDFGNLELLLQAHSILKTPKSSHQLNLLATKILKSIAQNRWLCGDPLKIEVETPGLMTGLAGIGYELLRLAEPNRVPSVLVLEQPY